MTLARSMNAISSRPQISEGSSETTEQISGGQAGKPFPRSEDHRDQCHHSVVRRERSLEVERQRWPENALAKVEQESRCKHRGRYSLLPVNGRLAHPVLSVVFAQAEFVLATGRHPRPRSPDSDIVLRATRVASSTGGATPVRAAAGAVRAPWTGAARLKAVVEPPPADEGARRGLLFHRGQRSLF